MWCFQKDSNNEVQTKKKKTDFGFHGADKMWQCPSVKSVSNETQSNGVVIISDTTYLTEMQTHMREMQHDDMCISG